MPVLARIAIVSIVSVAAVAAAFAFAGRYHVTTIRFGAAGGYIMMADRFTGAVFICTGDSCRLVPYGVKWGANDPVVSETPNPRK